MQLDHERLWIPSDCGNDEFFQLKENGQEQSMRDREAYRDGVDPTKIDASARMGTKKKLALMAVRRRALIHLGIKEVQS